MDTEHERTMDGNGADRPPAETRRRAGAGSSPGPGKEPLQVRIPTQVKRQFKAAAAMRGLEPHELFVEVWDHYQRTRAE